MLTLANTALLGLITLAALPLLVHLFARTRPPVYAFSSVEFLRKIVRTTMRVKKPRDILLLILRTLAVLCLVLVFLRPLLFSDKRLSGSGERKNVVLVIDATASMAYVDGAQSRFAAACAKGAEVLDGLGPNDRANVVWIKTRPEAVFPEMGTAHDFLADALRKARVSDEPGNINNALAIAAAFIEEGEGSREIWVLSDFQSSQWKDFPLASPESIALVTVPIGEGEAPNVALTRLECEPRRALVGEETNVLCEVRNFSSQHRQSKVYLEAGEVRQTQDVMVAPWSSAAAIFKCRFTTAAQIPVRATLDEDAFPLDDRRFSVLGVRESLNVGILDGDDPATAAVWSDALDALGWAKVREIDEGDLGQAETFDVLLLAGWNGKAATAIETARQAGSILVALPAEGAALAAFGGAETANFTAQRPATPVGLTVAAPDDGLFRIFKGGAFDGFSSGQFKRYLTFPSGAFKENGIVLLAYGDAESTPALLRLDDEANPPFYLWNLPLGSENSNWQANPGFLALFGELLLTSYGQAKSQGVLADSPTGSPVIWNAARDLLPSEVTLVDAENNPLAVRSTTTTTGTRIFQSETPPAPGLYFWQVGGTAIAHSAVNAPIIESDLRPLSPHAITPANAVALDARQPLANLREGSPLWPWLLGLAALFLVLEGLVTATLAPSRAVAVRE